MAESPDVVIAGSNGLVTYSRGIGRSILTNPLGRLCAAIWYLCEALHGFIQNLVNEIPICLRIKSRAHGGIEVYGCHITVHSHGRISLGVFPH